MIHCYQPSGLDASTYHDYKARFEEKLSEIAPRTYWRQQALNFLPGIISKADNQALINMTNLLLEATTVVINTYSNDERIQRHFDLSPDLHELTVLAGKQPFRPCTARPDFVVDRDMQPRICEINSRFPANGLTDSYLLNQASSDAFGTPQPFHFKPEMLLGPDDGHLLALVQKSEIGVEIWPMVSGRPLITAHPGGLREENGRLYIGNHAISKLITELDRTEFLFFTPEVRHVLCESNILLNDLRNQLLLHDKRMLSVLWDEGIMADLMDKTRYKQLRPFLIPSYRADDDAIRDELLNNPARWILKPASGGRGVGALVGQVTETHHWREAVDNGQSLVAQHYIDQARFNMIYGVEKQELLSEPMTVVGSVPSLWGKALGSGMMRASNELLVNLSGGRAIMFGCNLES